MIWTKRYYRYLLNNKKAFSATLIQKYSKKYIAYKKYKTILKDNRIEAMQAHFLKERLIMYPIS
jgi:hypothetical protein